MFWNSPAFDHKNKNKKNKKTKLNQTKMNLKREIKIKSIQK